MNLARALMLVGVSVGGTACYGGLWDNDGTSQATSTVASYGNTTTTTSVPLTSSTQRPCIWDIYVEEQPPHAISVMVQVLDCETCDGLAHNLIEADFEVVNDQTGQPFDRGQEGAVAFANAPPYFDVHAFTVIMLDLSESVYAANAEAQVFAAARAVADSLKSAGPPDVEHVIVFGTFGNTVAFSNRLTLAADIDAELAAIQAAAVSQGTTDLYGAYQDALGLALAQFPSEKLALRQVVMISDGTHEAGDRDVERRAALNERNIHSDDLDIYALSVPTAAIDNDDLCDLAEREDVDSDTPGRYCASGANLALVSTTFDTVDEKLERLRDSIYSFGICTPVLRGEPEVELSVSYNNVTDTISRPYSIVGFDGSVQDCNPNDYLLTQPIPGWP